MLARSCSGHYNGFAVGVLSTPLPSPGCPRSEGATESGSGQQTLGRSSLCLGVFVVNFFSVFLCLCGADAVGFLTSPGVRMESALKL